MDQKKLLFGVFAIVAVAAIAVILMAKSPIGPLVCPSGQHVENSVCVSDLITPPITEPITGSFSEQYSKMAEIWQDKGVKSKTLHQDFGEVAGLDEGKLQELRSEMEDFGKRSDNKAMQSLSDVYVSYIDVTIEQKNATATLEQIKSSPEMTLCDKLELYGTFNTQTADMSGKIADFSSKLDSFIAKFPENSSQLNFSQAVYGLEGFDAGLNENQFMVLQLKDACRGDA